MKIILRQSYPRYHRLWVQCPPQRRTVRAAGGLYRVRTPHTVFFGFNLGPGFLPQLRVFWRPQPVTSLDDTLHKTWFTNVDLFGQVCMDTADVQNEDPEQAAREMIDQFWSSAFTFDWVYQVNYDILGGRPLTNYYQAWQDWTGPLDSPAFSRISNFTDGNWENKFTP